MKHLIIFLTALTCAAAYGQIGVDAIAKQRAKDVANQNNNRNVEPGDTAARPAAPIAPAAPPPNNAQQAYARFQAELFSAKTNSSEGVKQQFARDLAAVAQGANKPSSATANKLSEHLTTAFAEANLNQAKKTRVAQEVAILLNSASKTPTERLNMINDVKSTLETSGASGETTSSIAGDLQAVTDEIQKPAAK